MRPAKHLIEQWKRGRDLFNDAGGNLASMSAWLASVVKSHGMAQAAKDHARQFADVFAGIEAIHLAYGSIPDEIYKFRYRMMSDFLTWVKLIDPELHRIFNSCL